ncbi:DNA glycosylase [Phyllosticta capitalensis]
MSTRVTRSTTRAIDALMNAPSAQPAQVSTPPAIPAASKKARSRNPKSNAQKKGSSRKRARTVAKIEVDVNELPHNLGSIPTPDSAEDEKPKSKKPRADAHVDIEKSDADVRAPKESSSAPAKKTKSKKANNYGLTPGVSPYPDWEHPTKEECYEVTRLLESVHGKTRPPPTIPAPSLTVTGCGEVPSVLDALIRTRLSAATTGKNSASAFQGLVKRFGIIKEGIGKGSVDWDAVRRADVKDVKEAIKSGGLADVKSKDIKKILDMVYEENQARRDGLTSTDANAPSVPGAAHESTPEKQAEIERANSGVLSLDHLHAMKHDPNLIMSELTRYPGIGVKTASCVMLFCIQVPSFAVDTHVYRLCRYLNWVPEKATRDTAYSHCDVRIPDELKYPLHQLFIAHGKTCPRCRAATSVGSAGWEKGCVIDHLVKRHGVRKAAEVDAEDGTPAEKSKPKGKGKARAAPKKNKKKVELEDEESESELSDLGSDETASEHDDSADEKELDD